MFNNILNTLHIEYGEEFNIVFKNGRISTTTYKFERDNELEFKMFFKVAKNWSAVNESKTAACILDILQNRITLQTTR